MEFSLFEVSKEYIDLIERMEKTNDPTQLQVLEEMRIKLHSLLMDMLEQQGIKFTDRDHATRIAHRIVNGEI